MKTPATRAQARRERQAAVNIRLEQMDREASERLASIQPAVKPAQTAQLGQLRSKITLGPDGITMHKQTYPAAGARAEVSDFRFGLVGRRHTTYLTITLASGEVLTWHDTQTGSMAWLSHNRAVKFAAAVNTAAAR